MLYAIENNSKTNEYNYTHCLTDLPYYKELSSKNNLCKEENIILNKIENKINTDTKSNISINKKELN